MDRQLIDYLPSFVAEHKEIKAIMDAEQVSVENAWIDTDNVLNDQFITSATEDGVSRYEKILGIIPKVTHTLEERKFNILARINEQLPYTMTQLHNSLTSLCGKNGYSLKLDADNYELIVKLALSNEKNVESVQTMLYKMLPANMVTVLNLFNVHFILADYTHKQLASYTHKQVREDVIL